MMIGRFVGLICCRGDPSGNDAQPNHKQQTQKLKKPSAHVEAQDYSETDQKLKQTEESEAESSKLGSTTGVIRKKKLISAHSKGSSGFHPTELPSTRDEAGSKTGRPSEGSVSSYKGGSRLVNSSLLSDDTYKQQPDSYETFQQVVFAIHKQRKQRDALSQTHEGSGFSNKRVSGEPAHYACGIQQHWNVLDVLFNFGPHEDDRDPSDLVKMLVSRLGYCEQLLAVSEEAVELFAEINLSSIRGYTGRAKGGVLAEGINM